MNINNAKSFADKTIALNGDVCISVTIDPNDCATLHLFYDGKEEQSIKLTARHKEQLIIMLQQ